MSLPAEPRQKMINLMYLVLTAMLALNVSAEILNAFRTVDNSLIATNSTINLSTSTIMKSLEDKQTDPTSAAKAKLWYPKAEQAQKLSTDMFNYIQELRNRILKAAEFNPNKENKFDSSFKADNLDIATRIMMEEKEGPKLRAKLEKYKNDLLAIDPEIANEFKNSLQIDLRMPKVQDKGNKTWDAAYFHMVPTVAAITILSKFQNDVRTSENKVVAFCHQQVGQVVVRFSRFEPIIGQSTNYAMPGQSIEIKAGIGAFAEAARPTITIGGVTQQVGDSGFVRYTTMAAAGLGAKSIPVHIVYKDQDGIERIKDINVNYTVGQASTAIALPEMNVLYIGYPNKITVSASGVGAEKINVNVSGGGANPVRTGPGEFTINVSQQSDNCIINAVADGKNIGSASFRVRQMPEPNAAVGGKKSGDYVSASVLAAQPGVAAYIENFPLKLTYNVTRFKVVGVDENGDLISEVVTGQQFSPRAKNIIKSQKSGDILTVEDIYCTGPDGRSRKLGALVYNIN
ncbi:MAG TPA: gliding motility protein GldM [Flavitalea sp.]|nr:gliding motility protein GldM [Flavitalea sp.]